MDNNVKDRNHLRGSLVQVLFSALLLSLVFIQGIRYRMPENGFCMRMTCYAIPIALSSLLHGHPYDYTGYRAIGEEFFNDYNNSLLDYRAGKQSNWSWQTKKNLDRHFAFARACKPTAETTPWIYTFDDKGQVDFAYLSFVLFGTKPESLFDFYMVLMGFSCVLYIVCFYGNSADLFWLNAYLCTVYSVISLIVTVPELAAFHQPRCFDLLAFIPMMHLALLLWRRQAATVRTVLATVLQLFVFIVLYHARTSISWQILCIFFCTALVLWRSRRREQVDSGTISPNSLRRGLASAWPCLLLVVFLLALNGYKHAAYNEVYFKGSIPGRLMWHNILLGFSFNPNLSFIGEGTGDRWSYTATDAFYTRNHLSQSMGEYNLSTNLALHERLCRKMVFEILAWYPLEFGKTFLWYKPLLFVKQVSDLLAPRLVFTSSENPLMDPSKAAPLRYNPFRLEILLLLLASLLVSAREVQDRIRDYLQLSFIFVLFSLIPILAAYPAKFLDSFNIQYFQLFIYCVVSGMFAYALRKVRDHGPSAPAQEAFAQTGD